MIHVEIAAPLSEHVVGLVPNRDLDVAVSEIDATYELGRVVENKLDGRTSAAGARGFRVDVRNKSRFLELGDQGGNGCPRKPGRPGDRRLADSALHPKDLDHSLAVAMPEPR